MVLQAQTKPHARSTRYMALPHRQQILDLVLGHLAVEKQLKIHHSLVEVRFANFAFQQLKIHHSLVEVRFANFAFQHHSFNMLVLLAA